MLLRKFLLITTLSFSSLANAGIHVDEYGNETFKISALKVQKALKDNESIICKNEKKIKADAKSLGISVDYEFLHDNLQHIFFAKNKIIADKKSDGTYQTYYNVGQPPIINMATGEFISEGYSIPITFTFKEINDIIIDENCNNTPLRNNPIDQLNFINIENNYYKNITIEPENKKLIYINKKQNNTNDENFYSIYNEENNVWIYMERITKKNLPYLKKRFGCDAYMIFKNEIQFTKEQNLIATLNNGIGYNNPLQGYSQNDLSIHYERLQELESFMSMRGNDDKERQEYSTELDKHLPETESPLTCSSQAHPLSNAYAGAFRSFIYNMNKYNEVPTWIAYVSSKELKQPLFESEESTLSTDLKILMTVSADEFFYCPFGIYKSPISEALDNSNANIKKSYAMILHSAVATLIREIVPSIKYMIVRPLSKMKELFEKSDVPCAATLGENDKKIEKDLPYIKEQYNSNYRYCLYDPRTNEEYQINLNHWFSNHFYLTGITSQNLSFVTADCLALANAQLRK